MLASIRAFFAERGVMEVETPSLSRAGATDLQLEPVTARVRSLGADPLYLSTSPELPMKRMLAGGCGDIYQIARVFRDGELGRWHQPEFTLLEWYRVGWSEEELMSEVEALLARVLGAHRPLAPVLRMSYRDAFVEYLDSQPSVDTNRKIGTTGYCMTGSYTMRLAAAIPERIGAGASFHGGGLATDREDSPHLLAPMIKAGMLIAIAENDDERDPDAKVKLREAFDDAGVSAEIEVYEGTLHGWCPPDAAAYNEEQAERAWARLLALFERELGPGRT